MLWVKVISKKKYSECVAHWLCLFQVFVARKHFNQVTLSYSFNIWTPILVSLLLCYSFLHFIWSCSSRSGKMVKWYCCGLEHVTLLLIFFMFFLCVAASFSVRLLSVVLFFYFARSMCRWQAAAATAATAASDNWNNDRLYGVDAIVSWIWAPY